MKPRFELDDVIADPLVLGVVRGDRAAWFQLTLYVEQWVETHVPNHWRMRKARLNGSRDDVRDVLLGVIERIDRDDFRALRQYLDTKLREVPDVRTANESALKAVTFASWLGGLAEFAIRDHVRKRYGRAPRAAPDSVRARAGSAALSLTRRDLQSWAAHPTLARSNHFAGVNPALSRVLTARSILSYATEAFDARELSVFRRYLEQATFEELAEEFELADPQAARAEIRRLKERLRARFREPS